MGLVEEGRGTGSTYGTLVPLWLWRLGVKVPTVVTTVGILWSADYPRGEWPFAAVLLFCCLVGVQVLPCLMVVPVVLLVSGKRRVPLKIRSRGVFNPDIDPETSPLSMAEAVQARKVGALVGGLFFRFVGWSVALLVAAWVAPTVGLPPLDLTVVSFSLAGLCLVLSLILVSLGTATLGFLLAESRSERLWRQLLFIHILQFVGVVNHPSSEGLLGMKGR